MFKDNEQRKKQIEWIKNHKILSSVLGLSVFLLILIGVNSGGSTPSEQAVPGGQQQNKYAFDVPSLIGKNIDEIRVILGTPVDKEMEPTTLQLEMGTKEWSNSFNKDNEELLITYHPVERTVIDFFISKNGKVGSSEDKEELLRVGNLKENNSKYEIEFVKNLRDSSTFTGVKITPN